jgi:hypothetical protein
MPKCGDNGDVKINLFNYQLMKQAEAFSVVAVRLKKMQFQILPWVAPYTIIYVAFQKG